MSSFQFYQFLNLSFFLFYILFTAMVLVANWNVSTRVRVVRLGACVIELLAIYNLFLRWWGTGQLHASSIVETRNIVKTLLYDRPFLAWSLSDYQPFNSVTVKFYFITSLSQILVHKSTICLAFLLIPPFLASPFLAFF